MDRMPAFQRQDIEDVPGLECGVDIPFAPDFYSFNAVQDRDHKPSGLNGSLLAQGIGSTKREISVGQLGGRSSGTDGDHLIEGIPKQEFHDQIRATSTLAQGPNKHTIQAHTSPVFSASSLYGNTLRGSSNVRPQSPLGAAVLNPQITRPTSGLRNQYQLERPTQFSPTTYPSQPQTQDQHFPNMSPTDRVLGLQHLNGQTANTYQPFPLYSESYMRTPINQAPPQYNSSYQFRQQHDQHARTFSPLPSIIAQTPYHHQILDTPPMMRPMMRPIQPRTPPQTNVAEINQMPMLNTSTPSKIKHEDSSPRSTTRRRRESTIVAPTEMDSDSSASRDTGVPNSKEEDRQCIDDLVSAMMDGNDAEDNDGMIKTWNKLKLTKEAKIQHKCVELLDLLKKAHYQTIGDKKPVTQYNDFQKRFNDMCKTLRTQKTVCKHLLEPPYSHVVANDPEYAATRVINNRRVNDQKKQAINVGRKVMGQKGQGKGRKVSVLADDEPQSDYPFMSDEDSNVVEDIKPEPQSEPRRTRKVKKTHRRNEDDDSDYTVSKSASKKTKRAARRSRYEINENNEMVDTSENHNQLQPMTSSPVQNNAVNYGAQHAYAPILPAMHPYLQHNQNAFDNNQGHQYSDYSTQYNCSSGADHTSSDDLNGNGAYSSDMDAYGDIGYHGQEVSYETEYGAIPGSGY